MIVELDQKKLEATRRFTEAAQLFASAAPEYSVATLHRIRNTLWREDGDARLFDAADSIAFDRDLIWTDIETGF